MQNPLQNKWMDWGERLRVHVREHGLRWNSIAKELDVTEGTVRHWCNGTRECNMRDFFKLCAATQADPALILFGAPHLSPADLDKIGEQVRRVLTADPATSVNYKTLSTRLAKAAPLAAEKRANYRTATKR